MSDIIVINLENYRDRRGATLEPGNYRVQVDWAEVGESSQKKSKQISVGFLVVGGPSDGRTIVERFYPESEAAQFRLVQLLQAVNIPTPRRKIQFNVHQIEGRRLDVEVVEQEPYNNQRRTGISSFSKLTGSDAAAQDDDFGRVTGTSNDLPDFDDVAGEEPPAVSSPTEPEVAVATHEEAVTERPAQRREAAPAPAAAADDPDEIDLDDFPL